MINKYSTQDPNQSDFTSQTHTFLAQIDLGNKLLNEGSLVAAIQAYKQAIEINPDHADAYYKLGNAFWLQGQLESALSSYKQALDIQPNHAHAYNNLGNIFQFQYQLDVAIECYQKALNIKPDYALAYNNLGNAFKEKAQLEKSLECYQQALRINPNLAQVYYNLGVALNEHGQSESAIQAYQKALNIKPDYAAARFGICISQLPIVYSSFDEIQLRRDQYHQHLHQLAHYYQLAHPQEQAKAAEEVGSLLPFYLAYQALNDRPLQQVHGQLISQIMAQGYPQWSQAIPLPNLTDNDKVRIGFISGYFRDHSNWKIPIKGWVENLDVNEFELFGYHTGAKRDQETVKAAQSFDKFIQGPLQFEQWCELIRQDQLHVLIFPELGMDPMTMKLGCLRLAPIQIGSPLGHAQTSGLPTIDYSLSSELLEPENAQDHYTEKLVRLPNLAIHYTPLTIQPKAITKRDIGITEDEIMFWCCQSLYKYLPQHDDVFPRITTELSISKFVFLAHSSEWVNKIFRQRLNNAFEQYGLNYENHCIFLPRSWDSSSFAGTTAIADIFLDSIGWSGGNTSIEAIGHNVPIVTWPGDLMRGRVTMAFLKMMGIEETIASSKEEYVKIAVHLAQDTQYRQHISWQVAENKHKLYGDLTAIRALENFLLNILQKPRRKDISDIAETLRLAMKYHQKNDWDQAKQGYSQVLAQHPDHPEALYGLGMISQQMGDINKAEEFLSTAVQVQPDSLKAWFSLGNLRQAQGQLPGAEEAYRQILAIKPNLVAVHNNLGYTLQQQGKFDEAIACYQTALKLQPNCIEADVNLGNLLYEQGKLSTEKQIHYAQLNYQLGVIRKNALDWQTSEVYFRQAITLQPDFPDAGHNLDFVLQKQGHKNK